VSYDTLVRTVPDLVTYWPFNDAAAASAAVDAKGVANLTKAAGGTLGVAITGAGIDTTALGLTTCAHIDGSVASPFVTAATAALGLNTKLTYMGWMRFTADAASAQDSIGRTSTSCIRVQSPRGLRSTLVTTTPYPGGQPTQSIVPFSFVLNEWFFVAMTWSQETGETRMFVNGVLASAINSPGAITAGSAAVKFGGIGVQADFSGWAMVGRALGASWLRKLYLAGVSSPATTVTLPGTVDAAQAVDAGGVEGMQANPAEASLTTAGNQLFREDQYALQAMHIPRVWPSSTDHASTVPLQVRKQIVEQVTSVLQRGHTNDPLYFDGTNFQWPGSSGTFKRSTFAVVVALLAAHRHARLHKRRSWALEFACSYGDYIVSQQNSEGQWFVATGAAVNTDTYFLLGNLALAVQLGGSDLGAARKASWTAAAELAATYLLNPLNSSYYVNGNLELDVAVSLYALWQITGKASWLSAFETQWTKTLYPTNSYLTSAGLGQGNAASAGYGLRDGTVTCTGTVTSTSGSNVLTALSISTGSLTVGQPITGPGIPGSARVGSFDGSSITMTFVNGSAANATASASGVAFSTMNGGAVDASGLLAISDTTGKVYLTESATPGFVGIDWDYLGIDVNNALKLWYMKPDEVRFRKLLNGLVNKVLERLNKLGVATIAAPTTAATGGSLPAATYYTKVVPLLGGAEGLPSAEQSVTTTGTTSTVTQTWTAVSGATGYRVYYATASGAQDRYLEFGAVTTTGAVGSLSSAVLKSPPTQNNALNWIYDATNGARHNTAVSWLSAALEALVWSGTRSDLAIYDYGSHWSNKILPDFRAGLTSSGWTNENWFAYQVPALALLLMADPKWPAS
jgi:hypothetical protein